MKEVFGGLVAQLGRTGVETYAHKVGTTFAFIHHAFLGSVRHTVTLNYHALNEYILFAIMLDTIKV
jgi:hypothetical protein